MSHLSVFIIKILTYLVSNVFNCINMDCQYEDQKQLWLFLFWLIFLILGFSAQSIQTKSDSTRSVESSPRNSIDVTPLYGNTDILDCLNDHLKICVGSDQTYQHGFLLIKNYNVCFLNCCVHIVVVSCCVSFNIMQFFFVMLESMEFRNFAV